MTKRAVFIFSLIVILFSGLILRLHYLSGDSSAYASNTSNTYLLTVSKSRGNIYDRNLNLLVSKGKKYRVAVLPSANSKIYLKNILSADEFKEIEENFSLGKPFVFETENYVPNSTDIKTFSVSDRYSDSQSAVHFIGYCDNTFLNGISGVEKAYNSLLNSTSQSVSLSYSIDAMGRALWGVEPTVNKINFNSKSGVALTLDAEIQDIVEKATSKLNAKGCALVMDINTGEILAGVSMPVFNPNNVAESINNNDGALLNRLLCAYNIGSTYKIIVSAAALSKNISPHFSNECVGNLNVGDTNFSCHKKDGHGYQSMANAFSNSCNPYFIKLGTSVGKERLLSLSSAFGIGKEIKLCDGLKTAAGNLPTQDEIKSQGDLANISFGQGSLMATPIHIARIISAIANGGYLVDPTLVLGEVNSDGKIENSKQNQKTSIISSSVASKIKEFMILTVSQGTGRSAKPESLMAGGKTASAETGWNIDGENIVQAWFSGFYPAEKPQYAIVVLSEAGNSGAVSCAPIFKEICDNLYEKGFCK